jgi:hypothetical protein
MILSYEFYLIFEKSKLDYEEFLHQNESEVALDLVGTAGVAALAAGVGGALLIGSGIKASKIKKQLKPYQQLVMKDVMIEINYLNKKKSPSWDNLSADQKNTLEEAKKRTRAAIQEEISLIEDQLSNLATNEYLKTIESNGKLKAKLLAAKELSKHADGEYQDSLKQRVSTIKSKIQTGESKIKELEIKAKKEEPKPGAAAGELTNKENKSLTKAEAGLAKAREAGDVDKITKYEDLIKGIKDTKKLGESLDLTMIDEALELIKATGYISESIATKFKRAMDQKGPRL